MGRPTAYEKWIWVKCPTCRGKGTKGYDKNGPKPCPLCTTPYKVGRRTIGRIRKGWVKVPDE